MVIEKVQKFEIDKYLCHYNTVLKFGNIYYLIFITYISISILIAMYVANQGKFLCSEKW